MKRIMKTRPTARVLVTLSRGVLAKSNGELVEKVVRLANELGRGIASPAEAREILSLKPLK